jgi:hypothetical protein
MRDELERFVASLAIPEDRKAVVLAELGDHLACARETAAREGRDPDAAERDALGGLEALRRSLESVEPAFRVSRWHALGRGALAGVLVAVALDQGGALMRGALGAVFALAVVLLLAPPRVLELLRAELRASPVRGTLVSGSPIGPALVYAFTVMSTPFCVWIALIVVRAQSGGTAVDVPWSAFAVMMAVYAVLFVEGVRARLVPAR